MATTWPRRRVLTVVGGSAAAALPRRPDAAAASGAPALTAAERATLRALADEVIPAADGMPSASEAGATAYLEALASREKAVGEPLRRCLRAADRAARSRHHRAFARLGRARRVAVLGELERTSADTFAAARTLVYEGYYTQLAVQKKLGFAFVPLDGPAAPLEPFDEAALARVKASGRLYREVR
jgi:hypothetical protein